ncbi:MAG: hypothetical protein HND58_12060 [Planctomycetota bacterium]|nr:MAG: hypothetical protein HND58_12060 [Planctomycetota bacterium]
MRKAQELPEGAASRFAEIGDTMLAMDIIAITAVWGALTGSGALAFEGWKWIAERRRRREESARACPMGEVSISTRFHYQGPRTTTLCFSLVNTGAVDIPSPSMRLVFKKVKPNMIVNGQEDRPEGESIVNEFVFDPIAGSIPPGEKCEWTMTESDARGFPDPITPVYSASVSVRSRGVIIARLDGDKCERQLRGFGHKDGTIPVGAYTQTPAARLVKETTFLASRER